MVNDDQGHYTEGGDGSMVLIELATFPEELMQLLSLTGAEVVDDPWDLASHRARYKLVLRCVDSDAQPPTPAEIELFNGGQCKLFL